MMHFFTRTVEDFIEHFELGVANIFRRELGPFCSIVHLCVRHPGVERGLDTYNSS